MKLIILGSLVLILGVVGIATMTAASPPAVFEDMIFKDAKAASIELEKLFIVDATATWCGPCKMMDKTTWIDPSIVSWIDEHAIAIQLDVDQEKVGARMLKIEAMPTIIIFKEGKEFDRVIGYKDAEQLLEWLEGVRKGRRDIDRVREAAGERVDEDGNVDIDARYELAETLLRGGEFAAATDEYVWLWGNMLQYAPSMSGVRVSFMQSNMQELARKHEPARLTFGELRDKLWLRMETGSRDIEIISDWICLNSVIDDEEATIDWYESIKDEPDAREIIEFVDYTLYHLLVKRSRWADAGNLYRDPVAQAKWHIELTNMSDDFGDGQWSKEQMEMIRESQQESMRLQIGTLYAACLAAEREKSAGLIADLLLETQDSHKARMALIDTALKAGQAREQHLVWLDEVEADGDKNNPLRRRLKKALIKK